MSTRVCLHCGEEIEPVRIPHRPPAWRGATAHSAYDYRCLDAPAPYYCHDPEATDVPLGDDNPRFDRSLIARYRR